ncbi:CAP domain-containing protein [Clostridium sp. CTA-19]
MKFKIISILLSASLCTGLGIKYAHTDNDVINDAKTAIKETISKDTEKKTPEIQGSNSNNSEATTEPTKVDTNNSTALNNNSSNSNSTETATVPVDNSKPDVKPPTNNESGNKEESVPTPEPTPTPEETPSEDNSNYESASNSNPSGLPSIPKNYSVEYLTAVENRVLELCNVERQKAGLSPLSMDETMRSAARYKAEEMLQYGYFDHTSPYTGGPFDLLNKFGVSYGTAGENIQTSTGYDKASVTAEYLVNNWMNSAGHRANILNGSFNRMGVGVVFSPNGNIAYESQLFAD